VSQYVPAIGATCLGIVIGYLVRLLPLRGGLAVYCPSCSFVPFVVKLSVLSASIRGKSSVVRSCSEVPLSANSPQYC
jgi:hypothetical protein